MTANCSISHVIYLRWKQTRQNYQLTHKRKSKKHYFAAVCQILSEHFQQLTFAPAYATHVLAYIPVAEETAGLSKC